MSVRYPATMRIELLEHPEADTLAREDASDGEFYLRLDGSVWYRNGLAPGEDCFVSANQSAFLQAVEALQRYNADVGTTAIEEEQMVFVRRLADDLRSVGALSAPADSFWPLIAEQAEHGMV